MHEQVQTAKIENNGIPEKFIDPQTGAVRLDALAGSYLALERKLAGMMPRPDSEEGRREAFRCLGCPDTPDGYEVDVSHGLFAVDPDVNTRLHAKGLTADQVQEVYNLAAEKLVPAILEMTQEFAADREVERLVAAFGGAEKWTEISRQLLAFGTKNLPKDVLASLSSSFEGVMALYRMMKGQDPDLSIRQSDQPAGLTESDLRGMMRDPRYFRERDPAFVAKVTEGFRRIYGE